MAVKNAAAKTWTLPTSWNGRRYSDASKVPPEGGGGGLPEFARTAYFEFGSNGSSAINTTDGFDNYNSVTGSDLTVTTSESYSGTRSARSLINASDTLWGGNILIPSSQIAVGDEVWCRARIKIPTGFDADTGDGTMKFVRIRTYNSGQVPNHSSTFALRGNTPTPIGVRTEQEDSAVFQDTTFTVPINSWALWEFYVRLSNDNTGILRCWVDGVLRGEVTGVNTAGSGWINLWIMFYDYFNNGSPQNQSIYTDAIEIATSRVDSPTAEDASGNIFIGTG